MPLHTPTRGGFWSAAGGAGKSLRVQVWDTGRGIPESEQARIFTEFYQVANPERDRSKGVGLGSPSSSGSPPC